MELVPNLARNSARGRLKWWIAAGCGLPFLLLAGFAAAHRFAESEYSAARERWTEVAGKSGTRTWGGSGSPWLQTAVGNYSERRKERSGLGEPELVRLRHQVVSFDPGDPNLSVWRSWVLRGTRDDWNFITEPLLPCLSEQTDASRQLPWQELDVTDLRYLMVAFDGLLSREVHRERESPSTGRGVDGPELGLAELATQIDRTAVAVETYGLSRCTDKLVTVVQSRWRSLATRPSAEQMPAWVAWAEVVGGDDARQQYQWAKRWGWMTVHTANNWKSDASRDVNKWEVPLLVLRRPWALRAYAHCLDSARTACREVEQGTPFLGTRLVPLRAFIPAVEARHPLFYPGVCFATTYDCVVGLAQRRARLLAWLVVLGEPGAAGDEIDLAAIPAGSRLRFDPCSGLPFRVWRDGNEIVVRGLGFDGADDEGRPLVPLRGFGSRASDTWDRSLEGDVEVRVEIPSALR